MRKHDDQPIVSWVSDVKKATFQLEATSITTINEDIILALTEGLPESFLLSKDFFSYVIIRIKLLINWASLPLLIYTS